MGRRIQETLSLSYSEIICKCNPRRLVTEQNGSKKLIFDINLLLPAGLTPQQGRIQNGVIIEQSLTCSGGCAILAKHILRKDSAVVQGPADLTLPPL